MDGTLVDSEELHWVAWRETMAAESVPITHEQFLASFGRRNEEVLSRWLGSASTPERVEKISNSKDARYRDLVRTRGIAPLPGVSHWVAQLHNDGWRQAIASSAPRLNVEVVMEVLGFSGRFQGIVSGEDVKRGKPAPEVYLKAAFRVSTPAQRCRRGHNGPLHEFSLSVER
jgi:beta-phosphoglucomutase-like phosphatase (HAD superfamily)